MTTDPKIYTAKEVASVGFSKEEIDQVLAEVTQKAYEAAKDGGSQVRCDSNNLNLLNEIANRLWELGYTTEIFERGISEHYIVIRWYAD